MRYWLLVRVYLIVISESTSESLFDNMNETKPKINFKVVDGSSTIELSTFEYAYRNLMVLLNDNIYLENFGECGGQGRCATCIIKVDGTNSLEGNDFDRNEKSTLKKLGITENNIRLSCQIPVTAVLQGTTIVIEQQPY